MQTSTNGFYTYSYWGWCPVPPPGDSCHADGEPRAQFAVVKGVDHSEDLPLIEAQAIGRLLLVLKMGPDVERVTYVGLYNAPVHWEAKRFMALLFCGSDKKLKQFKVFCWSYLV